MSANNPKIAMQLISGRIIEVELDDNNRYSIIGYTGNVSRVLQSSLTAHECSINASVILENDKNIDRLVIIQE